VPAGWILTLECLLAVTVGIRAVREVLGPDNMRFCPPSDEMECKGHQESGVGKRSLTVTAVASGTVKSGNDKHDDKQSLNIRINERNDTPFNMYKKIKHMLDY
jgi:hypothetical protein